MIIKSFELEQKINHIKFYLFYGVNKGLIEHTIKNQFKHLMQNSLQRYEESEVIKILEKL